MIIFLGVVIYIALFIIAWRIDDIYEIMKRKEESK